MRGEAGDPAPPPRRSGKVASGRCGDTAQAFDFFLQSQLLNFKATEQRGIRTRPLIFLKNLRFKINVLALQAIEPRIK